MRLKVHLVEPDILLPTLLFFYLSLAFFQKISYVTPSLIYEVRMVDWS